MNSIIPYLEKEYLTLDQLAQQGKISAERVLGLEETQCIPAHSYEISSTHSIACNLKGSVPIEVSTTKYYNPSIVNWIQKAEELAQQGLSLSEIAHEVRKQFNKDFLAAFGENITPGCKGLDNAWRYLMNGTWGVCLKEISVEFMANKELSRLKIQQLYKQDDPSHQLTSDEKQALELAVKKYESATKVFSPHLISVSSRATEVEPAVKKYL